MPALITHYLFGEQLLASHEQLKSLVTSEEERTAFLVGNQGPDPLFFRWKDPLKFVSTSKLGSKLHASRMSAFFDELRFALGRLPQTDQRVGRAFALGFLGHYTLDRMAHPFIYAQQYMIVDLGEGLEQSEGKVHALVESDLDSMMLWRLHRRTVEQDAPADVLMCSSRSRRVAGALVAQAANVALGEIVEPTLFGHAIEDMTRFYQLSEPEGNPLSKLVGNFERLAKKDSLVQALGHKVVHDDRCAWANEEHAHWTHPFTGEDSCDSFQDRFDAALNDYVQVSQSFLDGAPAEKFTQHIDYSGRHLDADEQSKRNMEPIRPWKHR
ncbi:MAG: hypothetical protein IJ125_00430 [Atopobiaceae bacterium]|nr:hypothetical protein [Atopobiaceae bacterium]